MNHLEGCRAKPFNEILLARIAEDSFEDCPHKCRPDLSFGKNLNKIIESMPICKNRTLHYCFERVRRKISKDILDKPCTKVQVWPLANFFLSPFGKKIIYLSGPLLGQTLFSSVSLKKLAHLRLQPLNGFLSGYSDLKQGPSTLCVCWFQNYREAGISCAALGVEVPGHRQQQLTQTLIVRLLKTHLFTPIPDCEKSTE